MSLNLNIFQRSFNVIKHKSSLSCFINNFNLIAQRNASADSQNQLSNSSQYSLELVKKYDYENFLATLLLKGDERGYAFAVRALNVEVSRISSVVSDDKIGLMRLTFWEDAVQKMYDPAAKTIPEHPVIRDVKRAIDSRKLTKRYFQRLITIRGRPSNQSFITSKELEEYGEAAVSSVLYLLLEINGIRNMNADHAASHLGKAQGIVNLLRSIPYVTRSKAVPIPQEVLMKHGVSQERIIRNKEDDKGVQECIFEVAGLANQHLEKSRNLMKSVPSEGRSILLPAVAVERYLEKLRRVNFHLTNQSLMARDTMLPFAYYWTKIKGKY